MSCSSIRDYYGDRYDARASEATEATFELRVQAALDAMGTASKRILDFGCNRGAAAKRFVQAGHVVHGVDISTSAIRIARENVPGVEFGVVETENRMPFPDASFDVCFASEVIEHLFDVSGFVREAHRVLTPGGTILLTAPYHGWIKNMLVVTFRFERHFAPTGGHIRFFSRRSLTDCLEAGGFRVEQIRGIGRFWPVYKTMFAVARKGFPK